jgi:hypothetical protein
MFSISADFSEKDLENWIMEDVNEWFDELVETFREKGREFTTRARAKTKSEGGFGNITWNLRSSIGYCLMYENKVVESYFPSIKGGTSGEAKGRELAETLAIYGDHGDGIVLVLVAGEDYASFVKAKGYDVIQSSSAKFETELTQLLG